MVVVRPLNIWLCTRSSDLNWRQKLFLSWVAPRGIVSASVASLFAILLTERGISGGDAIKALVFLTIILTVLVQGLTDHLVMHYASRALFGAFLDAGIEIHEHAESELHAKVAVFDGRVACVGSSNIDPFSLLLAREANVFVSDGRFASSLRGSLLEALERARPLPPQDWKRQPFWVRWRIWVAYGVARLLMSLSRIDGWH